MDILRVSPSVRRVTILQHDGNGHPAPVVIYERKSKKKRGSGVFRPVERAARRAVDAQRRVAESYLSRHDRSNEKRKDGWIRDFPINAVRAVRRGKRALKISRLLLP
jgi:Family of unknown function (DUF6312)